MTLWYVARAAGIVAMVMFTMSASLGILTSGSRDPGRRFWLQYVHRSAAATGLVLLTTHVIAVIADSYVNISPTALLWPFGSGYRPFAMVVGVLALYGLVLAAVVGAARGRLAESEALTKHWRSIHIAASIGWLLSVGHSLLAGTDRGTPWMLAIALGCLGAVAVAGAYRARSQAARGQYAAQPRTSWENAMTTSQDIRVRVIGGPRLLAGLDHERLDLQRHHWTHGTQPDLARETYTRLAESVGLRGRGGAAFPVALKLADLPARGIEAVVVNGSESEPVSRKDRLLLTVAPHLVLDGAVGLARALGAPHVLIAVHDAGAATSVREAIVERDDRVAIEVSDTPGRFVAGEARAVLRALEGGPAVPPGRRVLPTRKGYHRRPTFLSNVETFAQLAVLARLGSKGFSSTGLISEPGTQLLTIDGAVRRPGVIETPTGVPLDTVLQFAGAEPGPVLLGGYQGRWLARTDGLTLQPPEASAGIILALGSDTCPLGEVHRVAGWLAGQSAGQCGPCVFGLAALVDDFGRLVRGDAAGWHDAHRHLGLVPGRGACAHPDGSVRFLASALDVFGEDVRLHLGGGGCGRPVSGVLPVSGGEW